MKLEPGIRVRTTRGLTRVGTIKCIRSWEQDRTTPRALDIAWDDYPMEICTFVSVSSVEPLGAIDQLGSLVAA